MAVNRDTLTLAAAQKQAIAAVQDQRTRDITLAWVRAWDALQADLQRILEQAAADTTTGQLVRAAKTREALRIMSRELAQLIAATRLDVSDDARRLIDAAAANQVQLAVTQLSDQMLVNWARTDPAQVQAIIDRSVEQITARHWVLEQDATQAMRLHLTRGLPAGDNPRDTARRMVDAVGGVFNGGLPRALVIARTETIDAYRNAAAAWQHANSDVIVGWQWVTSLGPRTCLSCLSHHGDVYPIDQPGPLDHQQGRCTRVPVTKSWSDLGFNIPEPAPVVKPGDGIKWLDRQPQQVQQRIMGDRRWQAWQDGQYPPEQWSVLRHTTGWRDSYHVGPLSPADGA